MIPNARGSPLFFDLTPTEIEDAVDNAIKNSQKRISSIISSGTKVQPSRGFKEIVKAIDSDEGLFQREIAKITLLGEVAKEAKVRKTAREATKKANRHTIAKWNNSDLYKVFKAYTPKPDERNLYEIIDRHFKDHGTHLRKPKREEVRKIKRKVQDLAQQFQTNINEDSTKLVFSREELRGLPGGFFRGRDRREDTGKYVVDLKYPDYYAIMNHAKEAKTRRKVNYYFRKRGDPENTILLLKIARLRQEEANVLGYQTYSQLALRNTMAGTPKEAMRFLKKFKEKIYKDAQEQLEWIKRFKGAFDEDQYKKDQGIIYEHDVVYYTTLLIKEIYGFSREDLRAYFPLWETVGKTLDIFSCLFSIVFEKVLGETWAPDVAIYNVYSAQLTYLGKVYLDLLPRQGKFSHYASFAIHQRFVDMQGKRYDPTVAILANFHERGLTFDNVMVLFHEFGHVFQQLFSATPHFLFAGSKMQQEDFIEAPSQLIERLPRQPNVLRALSSGKISASFAEKIYKANRMVSIAELRGKIALAELDLKLYDSPVVNKKDILEYWRKKEEKMGIMATPGTNVLSTFDHIVLEYSSLYYGYFWSLVCSISMFRLFGSSRGSLQEASDALRRKVLSFGGSMPASQMYLAFMAEASDEAPPRRFRMKEILEEINI